MQSLKLLLVLFLFGLAGQTAYGQDGTYLQGWRMIGESETFLDVSYCVIQCDREPQIFLSIMNENSIPQTISFDIVMTDPISGKQIIRSFRDLAFKGSEVRIPKCGINKFPDLIWGIPEGYDPKTIEFAVKFL